MSSSRAEAKNAEQSRYEVERTKQAEEREESCFCSLSPGSGSQLRELQTNLQAKIEGDTAREQALKTQIQAEGDQFKASVIAQAQEEVFRLKQELHAKSSGPMDTDSSESLRVEAQKNRDEIQRLLSQLDQETRAKNEVTQKAEAEAAAARTERDKAREEAQRLQQEKRAEEAEAKAQRDQS